MLSRGPARGGGVSHPLSLKFRGQLSLIPKINETAIPKTTHLWNLRIGGNLHKIRTRSCLVISVKTKVNFVPLKKSYLETLNQYLSNNLNGHSTQFLKLSAQNIEENITNRDAMFRLQRDES